MANVEQRLSVLEERVAFLQDAYERNVEFIGKKLVEHAVRLDRIEDKLDLVQKDVTDLKSDVKSMKSNIEAWPTVMAQIIRDEFAVRDNKPTS